MEVSFTAVETRARPLSESITDTLRLPPIGNMTIPKVRNDKVAIPWRLSSVRHYTSFLNLLWKQLIVRIKVSQTEFEILSPYEVLVVSQK